MEHRVAEDRVHEETVSDDRVQRTGEVLAYVGSIHNLKDLKEPQNPARGS